MVNYMPLNMQTPAQFSSCQAGSALKHSVFENSETAAEPDHREA